jgi:hypothetical protein
VSSATGLTWWSLGLVVAVSAVIGQVLRLGSNLLEVPISAMLVLGVGAATGAAAEQRIAETLIGAGIGVLSNLLFPPQVVVPDAAAAISGVADDLARLLDEAADGLEGEGAQGQELAARSARWLDRARVITHHMPETGAALLRAEESRRLNLRALRRPDAGPGLRQGLEAVEHSSVAIRMMFATLESVARRRADEERPIPAELRAVLAVVLRDVAAGLAHFGRLVRSEAYAALPPSVRSEAYAALPPVVRTAVRPPPATARAVPAPDPEPVRDALEDLHEARARLIDLLMVDPWEDPGTAELVAVLASTVERLLRELDLEGRDRRRRALTRPSTRPPARRPAARTSRSTENG